MQASNRDVVLYELNEVPWSVVDYYVRRRPNSHFAALVNTGQSLTTVNSGPVALQPWRTWPTLHTSMYDHNSFDLGQDPDTFRGDPIWDVADQAGLSVGLFGPLQSWPARPFRHGGFYIPDTFSQDSRTYPPSLQKFQDFNLAMTRKMGFDPNVALNPRMLAGAGLDLLRRGLTPSSAFTIARHLVRERKDRRYKAFRSALQVLPGFDLYWRLQMTHRPRLSIFFTNHVAGMMHRFWGDAIPGYTDTFEYSPDEVFGTFLGAAMDLADRQLGRIRKYLAAHPQAMLVVAASMGQGPVQARFAETNMFFLEQHDRLVSQLGLRPIEWGMAMYPMLSLVFADETQARDAVAPLESVVAENIGPLFDRFRVEGKTLTFGLRAYESAAERQGSDPDMSTPVSFVPAGAQTAVTATPADLGFNVRPRTGGDNTGYHIPQGILLAHGAGVPSDPSRREVDVLDVAPSLLANVLGVEPGPMMRGTPSLFDSVHQRV